jgi:pimeloyl-ACP methyl ester carboxylesterase
MRSDPGRLLYLHGLESNSQTHKAAVIRLAFPSVIVPDFTGSLEERMKRLYEILGNAPGWTIIGSSLGGLMGALAAAARPEQIDRLVLLAPALNLPEFSGKVPAQIPVPTVLIQGRQDAVVPPEQVIQLAERAFTRLSIRLVDDDHRLHGTAESLDWASLLEPGAPA